jgi:hypothetical protein
VSTDVYELRLDENLCLEAVQESGTVYASDVVHYVWRMYGQRWKPQKATRLLCKLAKLSLVKRHPRVSAGWGQGWHPSAYSVAQLRRETP